jgi:phosphoribosylanthranilate isomerase
MTFVKICGITNLDDAHLASELGAAAIGLNFVPASPRYIEMAKARNVVDNVENAPNWIGVFVNEPLDNLLNIAERVGLNGVQLHGDETPKYAEKLKSLSGLTVIKAFRVTDDFDSSITVEYKVDGILLDGYSDSIYGGTGKKFDWEIAKALATSNDRIYLAGGIGAGNVRDAVNFVNPFAVDVCSGVERERGRKDPQKMKDLFAALR